jgi:hypothetical protein
VAVAETAEGAGRVMRLRDDPRADALQLFLGTGLPE